LHVHVHMTPKCANLCEHTSISPVTSLRSRSHFYLDARKGWTCTVSENVCGLAAGTVKLGEPNRTNPTMENNIDIFVSASRYHKGDTAESGRKLHC